MSSEIVGTIDDILLSKGDKEDFLRGIFSPARNYIQTEISDQLADFRSKRSLGKSAVCACFHNLLLSTAPFCSGSCGFLLE